MEDISITTVQNVLERLVNERKALAKGLEVVSKLASIEQVIQEREAMLKKLNIEIIQRTEQWDELNENISDLHKKREAACVERECESAVKVAEAEEQLEHLRKTQAALKESFSQEIDDLIIKRDEESAEYRKTIEHLKHTIEELKTELGALNARARQLAGA